MLKKVTKVSAKWCPPCRLYAETFKKVSEDPEFKDITFTNVDIDDDSTDEAFLERYMVKTVPTTLLLDEEDNLLYKMTGNVSEAMLREVIQGPVSGKLGVGQ